MENDRFEWNVKVEESSLDQLWVDFLLGLHFTSTNVIDVPVYISTITQFTWKERGTFLAFINDTIYMWQC